MVNSSMVTGRRCVDEGENKWFVESLFTDYKDLLCVLAWGILSMLAFGSALCCFFWCRYRSFRTFGNYVIINLLLSLSLFNATKVMQLFYFENATLEDKQVALFCNRLSIAWFSSSIFVMCALTRLNRVAKGTYILNHKYLKTNILAALFAMLLIVRRSSLSLVHYHAILTLVTLPGYVAYLTNVFMWMVDELITKQNRKFYWLKPCTYQTVGIFILGNVQMGEYVPEWNNYTWLFMVVLQMFVFVFYLASGDFYNMQMQCQNEHIKPIVSDAKNEVKVVTEKC